MATTPNFKQTSYLTDQVNRWLLRDLLGVDKIYAHSNLQTCQVTYACMRGRNVVCEMTFDDVTPIQDRLTALRTALRLINGNDTEGQKGGSP